MRASVAVSSGAMWTNCDDVQHAVQDPHGTAESPVPRIAPRAAPSHAAKSPAARPGASPSALVSL
jgi:hypothetical protein